MALKMRRGHTCVTFTHVPGCLAPSFYGWGWTTPPGSALVAQGLISSFQFTWKQVAEKLRQCQEPSQEGG